MGRAGLAQSALPWRGPDLHALQAIREGHYSIQVLADLLRPGQVVTHDAVQLHAEQPILSTWAHLSHRSDLALSASRSASSSASGDTRSELRRLGAHMSSGPVSLGSRAGSIKTCPESAILPAGEEV